MNTALDEQIRRAVIELGEAAPVARRFDELHDASITDLHPTGSGYRKPALVVGLLAVAALIAAIVINVDDRSDVTVIDDPTTSVAPTPPTTEGTTTIAPSDVPLGIYAVPTQLPEGLVLQRVLISEQTDVPVDPETLGIVQLFGTDPEGDPAGTYVSVRSYPADPSTGGDSVFAQGGPVEIRGLTAQASWNPTTDDPAETTSRALMWAEQGRQVEVTSATISAVELLAFVEDLSWAPDPADGFEPQSAALPLVLMRGGSYMDTVDYLFTRGELPDRVSSNVTRVMVGGIPSELAQLWQYGIVRPSGLRYFVNDPRQLFAMTSDGTSVEVQSPADDQVDRPDVLEVLDDLRPGTIDDVKALPLPGQEQLLELPVTATATVAGFTVEIRNAAVETQALCLLRDGERECRASSLADPNGTYLMFRGQGYFVGYSDNDDAADLVIDPVIDADTAVDGPRTYWVAAVPFDNASMLATIKDPDTGYTHPVCCWSDS